MYQNAMSPSQVYQTLFRNLPLVQQPVVTSSASFLVENLLRDGQSALISRPLTSFPAGLGLPGMGVTGIPAFVRGVDSPLDTTASSQSEASRSNNVTPYLKFGVNAILGSDSSKDSRSSKCVFPCCYQTAGSFLLYELLV